MKFVLFYSLKQYQPSSCVPPSVCVKQKQHTEELRVVCGVTNEDIIGVSVTGFSPVKIGDLP